MRPNLSSVMSDISLHSPTVFEERMAGVSRFLVASVAKALAPFSQNSKPERWSSGSGQAQPGQSYPSNRLTVRMAFQVRLRPASLRPMPKDFLTPVSPAATVLGLPSFNISASIGGVAFTSLSISIPQPVGTCVDIYSLVSGEVLDSHALLQWE